MALSPIRRHAAPHNQEYDMHYDIDDTPIINPHRQIRGGWGNVAPQVYNPVDLDVPELPGYPACAGTDPETFFSINSAGTNRAKRICATCPILLWCRETNLNEHYGVWGGLTEKQRQRIRFTRKYPDIAERILELQREWN